MAEEQKNVELPKETKVEETAPVVSEPAKEETPVPAATETVAPAVEDKPAEAVEESKAEEKVEEPKEDAKPIEEGTLSHKAQGLSFPK